MIVLLAVALSIWSFSADATSHKSSTSDHYVKPHVTKNGTYVSGHRQTNPNHTKYDNYSTKGNVNPYTGKKGTKNPY